MTSADSGQSNARASRDKVIAVVVTYRRPDILALLLESLHHQIHPLHQIVVVDNDPQGSAAHQLRDLFPEVQWVIPGSNLGPAGGWSVGIMSAMDQSPDWLWLFDDDFIASPEALSRLIATAHSAQTPCLVGTYPASLWRGRPVPVAEPKPPEIIRAEMTPAKGLLIHEQVIGEAGSFRSDFFMEYEEWEFCIRVRDMGFPLYITPRGDISTPPGHTHGKGVTWRGYYKARNRLAMALARRSVPDLAWWLIGEAKAIVAALIYAPDKWQRIRLRLLGAFHGLVGRMGKTIDPEDFDHD